MNRCMSTSSSNALRNARTSRRFERCTRVRFQNPKKGREFYEDERPLFASWPPSVPEPTVNDARDAYETCAWIPNPDARSQCYSSMGVDGMRVENYLYIIERLEGQLAAALEDGKSANKVKVQFGPVCFELQMPPFILPSLPEFGSVGANADESDTE